MNAARDLHLWWRGLVDEYGYRAFIALLACLVFGLGLTLGLAAADADGLVRTDVFYKCLPILVVGGVAVVLIAVLLCALVFTGVRLGDEHSSLIQQIKQTPAGVKTSDEGWRLIAATLGDLPLHAPAVTTQVAPPSLVECQSLCIYMLVPALLHSLLLHAPA